MTQAPLLEVSDLSVEMPISAARQVSVVRGADLTLGAGKTIGILGESGGGKSVMGLSLMGLIERIRGRVASGALTVHGRQISLQDSEAMSSLRGTTLAMIFQDSLASLDPLFRVGDQVAETYRLVRGVSRAEAMRRALEMLDRVGIPEPERRARAYPHQLSGGMRQRVMIATSLMLDPEILIADEPTTALDSTIQAQVLDLLRKLQDDRQMGIIFITHDVSVIEQLAHSLAIMYAGRFVETGPADELLARPAHPYLRSLLAAMPGTTNRNAPLRTIPGQHPQPAQLPSGCSFHPRCPLAYDRCLIEEPALLPVGDGSRQSACHLADAVLSGATDVGR